MELYSEHYFHVVISLFSTGLRLHLGLHVGLRFLQFLLEN